MKTERPNWKKKCDELFEDLSQRSGEPDITDLDTAAAYMAVSLIYFEAIRNGFPKADVDEVAVYVANHIVASLNLGRLVKMGEVTRELINGQLIYRSAQ